MSKSDRSQYNRPIGAKGYAAMAEVEGLRLSKDSRKRLDATKGLSPDKRRAEILRAYTSPSSKPKKK